MKKITFLFSVLTSFLIAAVVGTPVANFIGANPTLVTGTLFAAPFVIKAAVYGVLGFLPSQSTGFAYMAVQKETWVDYIIGNLFKDNTFLTKCYDESEHVLNGTVVHIPQAGAKPTVVKNRSLLPAVAVQRTDTDITYALDWYTSSPRVITNAEEKEVSYDKMGSVVGEDVETMSDVIAEDILYKWAPTAAANIIRTTGTAVDTALAPGATGTRKPLLGTHLRQAQATMNKQGISKADRWALIPDDMLTQLLADPALTAIQVQAIMDVKEGTIPKLYGFNILTRANACIYDNTGTPVPKTIDAATATTDNLSVLCWQKNAVAKAMGTTDFFENKQDATYYGDVYSAGQRCGGRKRRSDGYGVIAIVQAA